MPSRVTPLDRTELCPRAPWPPAGAGHCSNWWPRPVPASVTARRARAEHPAPDAHGPGPQPRACQCDRHCPFNGPKHSARSHAEPRAIFLNEASWGAPHTVSCRWVRIGRARSLRGPPLYAPQVTSILCMLSSLCSLRSRTKKYRAPLSSLRTVRGVVRVGMFALVRCQRERSAPPQSGPWQRRLHARPALHRRCAACLCRSAQCPRRSARRVARGPFK